MAPAGSGKKGAGAAAGADAAAAAAATAGGAFPRARPRHNGGGGAEKENKEAAPRGKPQGKKRSNGGAGAGGVQGGSKSSSSSTAPTTAIGYDVRLQALVVPKVVLKAALSAAGVAGGCESSSFFAPFPTWTSSKVASARFNVGGRLYGVLRPLLERYPKTLLAQMAEQSPNQPIYVAGDGDRFEYVLNYMRDGVVYLPAAVSKKSLLVDMDDYGFDTKAAAARIKRQGSSGAGWWRLDEGDREKADVKAIAAQAGAEHTAWVLSERFRGCGEISSSGNGGLTIVRIEEKDGLGEYLLAAEACNDAPEYLNHVLLKTYLLQLVTFEAAAPLPASRRVDFVLKRLSG